MQVLSLVLFSVLAVIGLAHVYWAFGGVWPADNERALIDAVIGNASMAHMPSMPVTLVVAVLIFMTALIALVVGGFISIRPFWLARLAAIGVGLVFLARGVGGYFFQSIAWNPVEPFATLNVWMYSPLCILIGAIFFILAFSPAD